MNGSIAGSALLTVNGGGTLGGTGTVGATNINGGTLAPGNSVGTITVQGNLTFGAGATYAVEVSGTADRTNVTGTAALAGTVAPIAAGAATPGTYTILSAAGGRTGAFTALDETRIPAFNASLGYTATDVLLTLTSGIAQVPGLNPAQSGIGTILDGYINSGAALSPGLITLLNLSQPALSGALTQLSGQAATGATPAATQLMSSFLSLLLNPFTDGRGGFGPATGYAPQSEPLPREIADAYAAAMPVKAQPAAFAQRWSVWGAAYGGVNKTDGNLVTGVQDLTARAYGFAAGSDYRVAPDPWVGFALAGGGTNWHLPGGLGTGKSDAFQAGVYAIRQFGAAYVSGGRAGLRLARRHHRAHDHVLRRSPEGKLRRQQFRRAHRGRHPLRRRRRRLHALCGAAGAEHPPAGLRRDRLRQPAVRARLRRQVGDSDPHRAGLVVPHPVCAARRNDHGAARPRRLG